ncbi:hypothetical protein [Flavobacterium lacisediminis]|uniref:Uncharacterized protein n=1 Tax=Flavobacterium lacisediminis TaxID=2989705 RepID=A0ABT3EI08_9FLAO|nr:hypothetical protein [Flavobacterium lacisediminis]MCW1148036.1 hypothetical protein [Flavobacterium lacisediminis]
MDENTLDGKIAVKQKEISVANNDPEKKKVLQAELLKLNLRKQLLKQTKITQNLKDND